VSDCIFCKIIAGEIPCNKAYEDELVLAFHDINPQAPVHVLIIPKLHVQQIDGTNSILAGHCFAVAEMLAVQLELSDGFRIVTNRGTHGGQTVEHLHFHLLGGRQLELTMG